MSQSWEEWGAVKKKAPKEHLDPRIWKQPDEPIADDEPVYSIPAWATSWVAIMALVVLVLASVIYLTLK
jgi:hypothetical protein